jgi:cobalt-zinc-cadmium efflux system protein
MREAPGHDHTHGHALGHAQGHAHAAPDNERRVLLALVLTGLFMLVEAAGGVIAGSLTLLADAGHMLTDTAALAMTWGAFRVSRRPHDRERTYGYHRVQVLAAFVNGATLIGIVLWIAGEAAWRLLQPVQVAAPLMLGVAAVGLAVNIGCFAILHAGAAENLNLRGASLHVLGDALGSAGAIAAALVILWTGWMPIDPLVSVLVALIVLRSAWYIVRHAGHILLEGAPDWLDVDELKARLTEAVPAIEDVHHVHAWMLTSERPLMTLHASVRAGADYDETVRAIHRVLQRRYAIAHATVQIEQAGACPDEPGHAHAH